MNNDQNITVIDILKAYADDLAGDLLRSVTKVKEYMDFISRDLKKDGARSTFFYRGDLTDSFFEVHRGIEGLAAINSAIDKVESFEGSE